MDFRVCENAICNKSCYFIFPSSDLAKEYNQILIPLLLDCIFSFPGWLYLKNFILLFLHYQKVCNFHTRSTAVLFYEPLELQLILANRIKREHSDTLCYTYMLNNWILQMRGKHFCFLCSLQAAMKTNPSVCSYQMFASMSICTPL